MIKDTLVKVFHWAQFYFPFYFITIFFLEWDKERQALYNICHIMSRVALFFLQGQYLFLLLLLYLVQTWSLENWTWVNPMDFHLPLMYQLYQIRDGYRYFLAETTNHFTAWKVPVFGGLLYGKSMLTQVFEDLTIFLVEIQYQVYSILLEEVCFFSSDHDLLNKYNIYCSPCWSSNQLCQMDICICFDQIFLVLFYCIHLWQITQV